MRAGCHTVGDGIQTVFLEYEAECIEMLKRLDKVLGKLNKSNNTETIILGARQFQGKVSKSKATQFVDAIKHDFKGPCYTTSRSDIIELK